MPRLASFSFPQLGALSSSLTAQPSVCQEPAHVSLLLSILSILSIPKAGQARALPEAFLAALFPRAQ